MVRGFYPEARYHFPTLKEDLRKDHTPGLLPLLSTGMLWPDFAGNCQSHLSMEQRSQSPIRLGLHSISSQN